MPTPPQPPIQFAESEGEDGTVNCFKEEPIEEKPKVDDLIMIIESKETLEKFQKYEADYAQRLLSKYFSDKNIYGGKIFELEASVDDKTVRASRWPCTQSFSDSQRSYEEYQAFFPAPGHESHGMSDFFRKGDKIGPFNSWNFVNFKIGDEKVDYYASVDAATGAAEKLLGDTSSSKKRHRYNKEGDQSRRQKKKSVESPNRSDAGLSGYFSSDPAQGNTLEDTSLHADFPAKKGSVSAPIDISDNEVVSGFSPVAAAAAQASGIQKIQKKTVSKPKVSLPEISEEEQTSGDLGASISCDVAGARNAARKKVKEYRSVPENPELRSKQQEDTIVSPPSPPPPAQESFTSPSQKEGWFYHRGQPLPTISCESAKYSDAWKEAIRRSGHLDGIFAPPTITTAIKDKLRIGDGGADAIMRHSLPIKEVFDFMWQGIFRVMSMVQSAEVHTSDLQSKLRYEESRANNAQEELRQTRSTHDAYIDHVHYEIDLKVKEKTEALNKELQLSRQECIRQRDEYELQLKNLREENFSIKSRNLQTYAALKEVQAAHQKEVTSLLTDKFFLSESKAAFEKEVGVLELEKQALARENNALVEDKARLIQELNCLSEEKAALEEQTRASFEQEKQSLLHDFTMLEEEKKVLFQEKTASVNKIAELEEKVKNLEAVISRLKSENAELSNKGTCSENLLKHIKKLSDRVDNLNEELSAASSHRDRYRAQVLTLEAQVDKLMLFSRQSQEELQKQGTIIAYLKETFASQCRKITNVCRQAISRHFLKKGEVLDDDLYSELEFNAVAQKSNFFEEFERFGRLPDETCFGPGDASFLPPGSDARQSVGGVHNAAKKSKSARSVSNKVDKLATKELDCEEVAKRS